MKFVCAYQGNGSPSDHLKSLHSLTQNYAVISVQFIAPSLDLHVLPALGLPAPLLVFPQSSSG